MDYNRKIDFAIKLLRSIPQDGPIELCYSGGKDSDVILELAKMSGIPFEAIYKDYDVWLGEANELARLILLYADKSTVDHNSDAVFDRLESLDGEGIITEDVLQRFYLR